MTTNRLLPRPVKLKEGSIAVDFTPPVTTDAVYGNLPTLGTSSCPLRLDILNRLQALFQYMVTNYAEVTFLGLELHYPSIPACLPGNALLGEFLPRFLGPSRIDGLGPQYAWSRGQLPNDRHQRYSLVVLLPSHPKHDGTSCICLAEATWSARIWNLPQQAGLVIPWPANGAVIRRDSPDCSEVFASCFLAASGLARSDTKLLGQGRLHSFGSSRI